MMRISDTAEAIALEAPQLEKRFRMPHAGDQALLQEGRAFVSEAESFKQQFIQHCLADDFVERLSAAVE